MMAKCPQCGYEFEIEEKSSEIQPAEKIEETLEEKTEENI